MNLWRRFVSNLAYGLTSLNHSKLPAIVIGVMLVVVGTGIYRGKGKVIHRFPGLTDSQQGLVLAVAGGIAIIWGVISLI